MSPEEEIGALDFERAELYDDPEDSGYMSGCRYDIDTVLNSLSRELAPASLVDCEASLMSSYEESLPRA
jgi:hypothetical protein